MGKTEEIECQKSIPKENINNPGNRRESVDGKSAEETLRAMALEDVRDSAEKLKAVFLGQMETRLTAMMDDVVDSLQKTEFPRKFMMSDPVMMKDKRKASVAGKLPEKVFRSRPSQLTELLEVPHFKTIYHIFIASLALIMLHTVILDLLETGTVNLGLERSMWAFGQPLTTASILLSLEFFCLFVIYPCFYCWSTQRLLYKPNVARMIDYVAAGALFVFFMGFTYIPAAILWKNPLPPASGLTVTMEQCRLLMKMYAFIRSNVPRALKYRTEAKPQENSVSEIDHCGTSLSTPNQGHRNEEISKSVLRNRNDATTVKAERNENSALNEQRKPIKKRESWISWNDENTPCPDYSKFVYFLFAPTLIYSDSYPRTSKVRWSYVCWNFAQVLGCMVYGNFIVGRYCEAYFGKFGHPDHPMTVIQFCNALFSLMLPSVLGLILAFFLVLHAWQNAFAEMLCFGDRMFYKDWWNQASFASYYKTWNVVVHDWLYTYIFKDAWDNGLGRKNKVLPTILVFFISSLFHEYIISFSLNFFFPVLLILFGGCGSVLALIKNNESSFGNVLMWMGLISGSGIIVVAYTMEFFARNNCPPIEETAWDFFRPRLWSCDTIVWS